MITPPPQPNPFTVFSPEGMPASDIIDTFVSDVPGVDAIQGDGHTILVGSRGCGKTMIFRFLEPDCQLMYRSCSLSELDYFAGYLSIKQTDLRYPEFQRIQGTHVDNAINEHILVITIIMKFISRLIDHRVFANDDRPIGEAAGAINNIFKRLNNAEEVEIRGSQTKLQMLRTVLGRFETEFDAATDYFDLLTDESEYPKFHRKICRFSNVLLPFINAFRALPGLPESGRFFLLIDDADNLNDTQTRVLNTWISQRIPNVSLKVATQIFEYKTFNTLNEKMIETPHDYTDINISDAYTSNKGGFYRDRIFNIVNRRLQRAGIDPTGGKTVISAEQFFPEDNAQRIQIERIRRKLAQNWETSGRGFRQRDDAYRYSVPDYIVSLGGSRKSRHRYSYSGFNQLVNISSGVPRYFLEAAHRMFDRELARLQNARVTTIAPTTQDAVLRQQAESLYKEEIGKLQLSGVKQKGAPIIAIYLNNLIGSLCSLFQRILLAEHRSERRVFSFVIQDAADAEVLAVLKLGIQNSYFSRTTIGRKEGFGRADRYILTRRLAPLFTLDPNGFSGYQFITNKDIRAMMQDPEGYRLKLRSRFDRKEIDQQKSLFDFVPEEP